MEDKNNILQEEEELLERITKERNMKDPKTKVTFRKLDIGDYDRGYYEVLGNLTVVGDVTKETFEQQFKLIKKLPETYKIIVGIDESKDKVVCNGSLILERKFIRNCSTYGHIEDIVVHKDYGRQNIGQDLLNTLSDIGKINKCYKLILD